MIPRRHEKRQDGTWPRLRDERGIAMISAVLLVMAMTLLGTVAVGLAVHNSSQSANNRDRTLGVAAAEAGIDWYFSHLQNASPSTVLCEKELVLPSTPQASVVVTPTFYDGAGNVLDCTSGSGVSDTPAEAVVRGVGRGPGTHPERAMEAKVELVAIHGGIFGPGAVVSDTNIVFNSNADILGGDGNNADVHATGDIEFKSNSVVEGNAYILGSLLIDSNSEIKKDAWSSGSLELNSGAIVRGDAISSTSTITLNSNAHVFGDAKAGGSITLNGNSQIDGTQSPNTPSGNPPTKTFPDFTFEQSDWENDGYTVTSFSSCSDAKNHIEGLSSGDHVVRITSTCSLSWGGNDTVDVVGDLAIIHDGGFLLDSNARFRESGGPHDLFFIVGLAENTTDGCDFEMNSSARLEGDLQTLIYTPCTARFKSNTFVTEGQVLGGEVLFDSNSSLTYKRVLAPGGDITGFEEDLVYLREVQGD